MATAHAPLLLLCPGMLNTEHVFDATRALLPAALEVRIASGRTQASIAEMARDAWQCVADVPAQRPLIIGGFSMGGYVALQMLSAPARAVQGLALICTSARADDEAGRLMRERAVSAIGKSFERFVGGMLSVAATARAQADEALMALMRQDMLRVGPETAIRQQRACAARADHRSGLPQLRLRASVIGAAEDAVVPPDRSREMAALIPDARLTMVEAVGHMLPWERPAELAALLTDLFEHCLAQGARA